MELHICGLDEVTHIKKNRKVNKILSLTEFVVPPYVGEGIGSGHTQILVEDIEHFTNVDDRFPPNSKVIDTIIAFGRSLKEDDVALIHCFAGISRSTAAALIIMVDKGFDPEEAGKFIRQIRSIAAPNRMLCKLADQYFGTYHGDGPLFMVADRMNNERGFRVSINNKLV
jgi:predicted protein tyrosine phosphatase